MGVYLKNDVLAGIVRVTTSAAQQRSHVHDKGRIPLGGDATDDEDDKNIQIADLNSLNAAFAVIKWKKLSCTAYMTSRKTNFSAPTRRLSAGATTRSPLRAKTSRRPSANGLGRRESARVATRAGG
jgi:hypothetical protein